MRRFKYGIKRSIEYIVIFDSEKEEPDDVASDMLDKILAEDPTINPLRPYHERVDESDEVTESGEVDEVGEYLNDAPVGSEFSRREIAAQMKAEKEMDND